MYLLFHLREVPFRSATLIRNLVRRVPMVQFEDCRELRVKCRGDLASVDPRLHKSVLSMVGVDALELLADPRPFRSVQRLTLSTAEVARLGPEFRLPQVRRLKLLCRDAALAGSALEAVPRVFPCLERLHLALLPSGLLPLCGPGFAAPPDLRITLLGDRAQVGERQANIFVASHLLTLPFSWSGTFLQRVVRLQMAELNQEHGGLALEQLTSMMRAMPQLRRLGTVSLRTFLLVDVLREECPLEELVLVMDMEDVNALFRSLLPLEQQKRRMALRRLAVHLLAEDGVARPKVDVENALCAGWHNIAEKLLRKDGFVAFSFGHHQLLETALPQLAWFDPERFSLDLVEYEADGRLPASTPLERPLPFCAAEVNTRPRGTLVIGSLRPSAAAEREDEVPLSPSGAATPSSRRSMSKGGLVTPGRRSLAAPTPSSRARRSRCFGSLLEAPVRHAFQDLSLVDAVEALLKAKQAH